MRVLFSPLFDAFSASFLFSVFAAWGLLSRFFDVDVLSSSSPSLLGVLTGDSTLTVTPDRPDGLFDKLLTSEAVCPHIGAQNV